MIEFRQVPWNGAQRRFDPLTGLECRINPARVGRPYQRGKGQGLEETILASSQNCPFCPQALETKTPSFPPELVPEGRLRVGESVFFPNLYPFAANHAVGVVSQAHFLTLEQFSPSLLRDNLLAARDLIRAIHRRQPEAQYPVYILNYLPPSASSINHPHSQLWVEPDMLPRLRLIRDKSREYLESQGRNYWEELAATEKELGVRFIGENRSLWVLASFAPQGFREVMFLAKRAAALSEATEGEIADLAQALSGVLRGYQKIGVGSFNLVSFSGGVGEGAGHFRLFFKLISRPYPRGLYINDSGPMERFYGMWVIDTLPEGIAAQLRGFVPTS